MKTIKNMVVLVLMLFTACMLLTGCNEGELKSGDTATGNLNPKKPVTVTLWHYYVGENQQAIETAVSDFNNTVGIQNGVVIDTVAMGSISELEAQITQSAKGVINAAPLPQLFSSYPDKAMEIDSYGVLADLNEYFTQEEKALYVADFLSDGIFDQERMLLLPIVKSTELAYVNATHWDAFAAANGYTAENLATWEELYQTAKAYYQWTDAQTPDQPWDGVALMGMDSVANYIIIGNKQLGVDVINAQLGENGGAVLNQTALRRVFDVYVKGMSMGYFYAEGKFSSDNIKAGNIIAYVGSSSSAAYFPTWIQQDNSQLPIEFLALPYPTFEGGEGYAVQQGAGMCITKSSPAQQEGAALFLKWFTAIDNNIDFAMTTGYLPVQTEAYSVQGFSDALENLRQGEKSMQNVSDVYAIALQQITKSSTYAAKSFVGSYNVRNILQSTLIQSMNEGRDFVYPLQVAGASEEEILSQLDLDARFQAWIDAMKQQFDDANIEYELI